MTFGCRLNIVESETMRRHAVAAGLSDAIIVNTCAVTAEAERQAGQAIRKLKRERPGARIIVTGCAAQIDPAKFAEMKEVDHVVANDSKLKPESFAALAGIALRDMPVFAEPAGPTGALQRAFVQVQNGCDHRCTFCIIPFGRGASRSLSVDEIAAKIAERVNEGFQEIVLTGVDIASYGHDLSSRQTLGGMLRAIFAASPDLPRLRLSSLDPAAIDDDLWDLIAHEPRLMPHLHLSLQAGDDMILKRMKRRHSGDDVRRLVDRARRLRPDIVFGADLIAGFPTETDTMAENTYALAERCSLTWLHVFPYSARKGTAAARMPHVHGDLRRARAEKLRALGDKAAAMHLRGLAGKTVEVLIERTGSGQGMIGCTPHFAKMPLFAIKDRPLTLDALVGQIVPARITVAENGAVIAHFAGRQ